MATPAQTNRKKIVHAYDPLHDWPERVYEPQGHVRYILREGADVKFPGRWADWAVQTTDLGKIADLLEPHTGHRFFTISAVIFDLFGTLLLLTDRNGGRHTVDLKDVRLNGVQTTRV